MFTGIIESVGKVEKIISSGANKTFWIASRLADALSVDQSIAHDGVCLTVEELGIGTYRVTAVAETLEKTNLNAWQEQQSINLERCMKMNGRLDGHIVQGHVDTTAKCIEVTEANGSWEYRFSLNPSFDKLMVEKGSISLNGMSLTLFNVKDGEFSVAIIPYTYHHTNIREVMKGDLVNVEFDMIGKYVQNYLSKTVPA
jgi:riboflavin synthase